MAVPKRKTSKCRRNSRSANKGLKPRAFTGCNNCNEPIRPHQACQNCGFYKNAKVLETKADRAVKRTEKSAEIKTALDKRAPKSESAE